MIERAVTDFPDPLSPTIARVSPASTEKPTPSTATIGGRRLKTKLVWSSRTWRRGASLTESSPESELVESFGDTVEM